MAIEGVKIDVAGVEAGATKISNTNKSLTEKLNEINTYMNTLGDANIWISDAEKALKQKYDALYPKFSEFESIIQSYVTFLNNRVVETYRTNETNMAQNANNISSFA